MNKDEISVILGQVARVLEPKGENPFKVRAIRMRRASVGDWAGNLAKMIDEDQLPGGGRESERRSPRRSARSFKTGEA
jgi:DNA polymerase/3'-5' exonuclease PolX